MLFCGDPFTNSRGRETRQSSFGKPVWCPQLFFTTLWAKNQKAPPLPVPPPQEQTEQNRAMGRRLKLRGDICDSAFPLFFLANLSAVGRSIANCGLRSLNRPHPGGRPLGLPKEEVADCGTRVHQL